MEWMEKIQNSAIDDLPELKHPKSKPLQKDGPTAEQLTATFNDFHDHNNNEIENHAHFNLYSKELNNPSLLIMQNSSANVRASSSPFLSQIGSAAAASRGRRALKIGHGNSKTTCALSIQTDPLLWKHISEQARA